ncbi:hypothetical protein DRO35_03735 [Candidatus Bathyarchaeota archaeon]|nr:MAG: hypothetical protein DRO35_03735 [Candidatus Bathyarchaeota archaeon]
MLIKVAKRNRIKIIYQPPKEIVILDYFQFSKNNLSQMFARVIHSGLPVVAYWAEGVLFVYFPLIPDTDDLMNNYLKGRIYWSSVHFTLMPKYSPSIKVSGLEIPVVDVSEHPVMKETAKWLREQAEKRRKNKYIELR